MVNLAMHGQSSYEAETRQMRTDALPYLQQFPGILASTATKACAVHVNQEMKRLCW